MIEKDNKPEQMHHLCSDPTFWHSEQVKASASRTQAALYALREGLASLYDQDTNI